jgi:hypothetical protein
MNLPGGGKKGRVGGQLQLLRNFLPVDEKRSGPENPTRRVIYHDLDEEDVFSIQMIGKEFFSPVRNGISG